MFLRYCLFLAHPKNEEVSTIPSYNHFRIRYQDKPLTPSEGSHSSWRTPLQLPTRLFNRLCFRWFKRRSSPLLSAKMVPNLALSYGRAVRTISARSAVPGPCHVQYPPTVASFDGGLLHHIKGAGRNIGSAAVSAGDQPTLVAGNASARSTAPAGDATVVRPTFRAPPRILFGAPGHRQTRHWLRFAS